ncbi:hypothetical protein IGI04_029799 [Brassica rapa subsp. trilocularis]|uniref:Transmembrane protein n=2 Tax=Brassica campestris TaxID=3711 RepID=M4FI66_BRACM|nr:uncharacterized protein LOC108870572 [Brassica rapa]KAG5388258.1 hypothetical protein IGI04_029799 [Brassica rapa subsp. trilocularis]
MEKKLLIVLFTILLVHMSLIISGVDCRALRTEQMNGCDQMAAVDGGGFSFFSAAGAANSSRIPLMRSLAFRLASGPSKRGRGH